MNDMDYDRSLSSIFTDGLFRFLVFILLFVSLLFAQRNLVLISILILAMFYISKIWSQLSVKRIHYSFDAEKKKGFPGETISLQASIFNNKLLPIWLKLTIPIDKKIAKNSYSKNNSLSEEFKLLWYDNSLWKWKITANHRGCFKIGPPYLETGDLLGFFKQRKYLSQSVEMIIYPKPIHLNNLSFPIIKELFGKPGLDSPVKDPIYPIATKDYHHGDPAKYIHWKASARHNRLQSKVFDSSSQRKIFLIIDVTSFKNSKNEDLFEKTLEVAGAIILEFDRQSSPYGLLSNGKMVGDYSSTISIATGPEQLSLSMEFLARLQQETESSMQRILFKENVIPAGTGCIYCAYSLNKKNIQITELLKQHQIPVYFIIASPSVRTKAINTPTFKLNEIHGEILESQKII